MRQFDEITDQAFIRPTPQMRELAANAHDFAPYETLPKPLNELDNWTEIEDIGRKESRKPWSPQVALGRLAIRQVEFDPELAGPRCLGYSSGHAIAIHPNAPSPLRVTLHELGHNRAGHTFERTRAGRTHALREMQAEAVSFAVMALIGAVTPKMVAVARCYIDGHPKYLEEPFLEAHRDQIDVAVGEIWQAGQPEGT